MEEILAEFLFNMEKNNTIVRHLIETLPENGLTLDIIHKRYTNRKKSKVLKSLKHAFTFCSAGSAMLQRCRLATLTC